MIKLIVTCTTINIINHQSNNLHTYIKIQLFTGYDVQLWNKKRSGDGRIDLPIDCFML